MDRSPSAPRVGGSPAKTNALPQAQHCSLCNGQVPPLLYESPTEDPKDILRDRLYMHWVNVHKEDAKHFGSGGLDLCMICFEKKRNLTDTLICSNDLVEHYLKEHPPHGSPIPATPYREPPLFPQPDVPSSPSTGRPNSSSDLRQAIFKPPSGRDPRRTSRYTSAPRLMDQGHQGDESENPGSSKSGAHDKK